VKKCTIYHEVFMYNTHGILMFTLFLQNVYTNPNDGLLRHVRLTYGYIIKVQLHFTLINVLII